MAAAQTCPGPPLTFEPLGPRLWRVPSHAGDGDADNRGQVSNLLVALDGPRLWLLGSGPSAAFGRALACRVRQRFGRAPTDVISPWARPEAVLGATGLGPVRSWAHAEVAAAMRERCPGCVERLKQRLGEAAVDVGSGEARIPERMLHGAAGRLGPWRWWRLDRGPGHPVTVWQFDAVPLLFAPGLLWGDGAPDGRDADLQALLQATEALSTLPDVAAPAPRWLGEQGGPLPPGAAQAHARYWRHLLATVHMALERGDAEGAEPPAALAEPTLGGPRHALNWQRAWRQVEERWLQRSLR